MSKTSLHLAVTVCSVVFTAASASAQTASYYWNFGIGASNTTAATGVGDTSNVSAPTMTIGNSFGTIGGANPNTTSPSGVYTIPAAANPPGGTNTPASGAFSFGQAVNNATFSEATSPYYQFTLSNITSLQRVDFGQRSTGTGATSYSIRYSTDGFNSAGTEVAVGTAVTNSAWAFKQNDFTDVSFIGSETVSVRLYEFAGAANAGSGTINTRIDDFSVSFTPVPEPATVLAVAAAGLGGRRLRRRLAGA